MAGDDQWMTVGRMAGPFGLRGEAKVEILTDYPERFRQLERVFLGPRHREYTLLSARPHSGLMLVHLEGIDTPEAVSRLLGQEVMIPRAEAVELPQGHYFLEDLVGLPVETAEGQPVGTIADVLRTGSNDVYVVKTGEGEVLVPGISDAVREVDVPGRRVVIEAWVLLPPQ